MSKIEQGKFYKIQYINGHIDTIESSSNLNAGCYYIHKTLGKFKVLNEVRFKYTFEDIDNIRVLMEDYEEGSIQSNLCKRMAKAFNGKTPSIRLSFEEKEILSYTYHENEHLSETFKETLRKVLDIK